jgi:hypothetical protein
MSALGQKRTFAVQNAMSALHQIADMCGAKEGHFRRMRRSRRSNGARERLLYKVEDKLVWLRRDWQAQKRLEQSSLNGLAASHAHRTAPIPRCNHLRGRRGARAEPRAARACFQSQTGCECRGPSRSPVRQLPAFGSRSRLNRTRDATAVSAKSENTPSMPSR